MALDATVGGSASNSYVSLADAEAYFADRLGASDNGNWNKDSSGNNRSNATKEAALVTATRRTDEEQFAGYKASTTQALKWPRINVRNEDGYMFDPAFIPERVKQAVYITALELLRANFLDENYLDNVDFMSTGTVQIKQFTQSSPGKLPAEARRLLRLVLVAGGFTGRIVRA